MQFTTQIPISKSDSPIDYNSKILSLGSCFAENMAEKLAYFKFVNGVNPFGILFHPLAINEIIKRAVFNRAFIEKDLVFHNELWHCVDVHSDLSNVNKEELLTNLNALLTSTKEQIREASHIIITYGTAWVYRHRSSDAIVANCHKIPQQEFAKEILSIDAIDQAINETIRGIHLINHEAQIIFTISPVRHIKDGFEGNQRSKAHLIAGLHQVLNIKDDGVHYFPSYEIMMDELRGYRYYATDMLHPSALAIEYIWERFAHSWIVPSASVLMDEVDSIQKSLLHWPFNRDSHSYRQFEIKLQNKIEAVQKQLPGIVFNKSFSVLSRRCSL